MRALFIDIRNDRIAFAAVDAKAAVWSVAPGGDTGRALAKAMKKLGLPAKKPGAVIVAVGSDPAKRNVSWSGVRAGAAIGNALAFAWGVPVAALAVDGDESHARLETMVRASAAKAKKGTWIRAAYSGEPNITKAKPII